MGRACLKFSIVFFNIPLMLIGGAALGVGIWILVNDQDFFDESKDVLDLDILGSDLLENTAMTMITAGAVVFCIGTLGCIGAFALSNFILVCYSLIMTVVLTVEVAVIVLAIVFRSEITDKADDEVRDRLVREYGNSTQTFTKSFDALQDELDCCGWENGKDFVEAATNNIWNVTLDTGEKRVVPDVCCDSSNQTLVYNCTVDPFTHPIYNTKGCKDEVKDRFEEYTWMIIGITAGLLAFQFLLIVLALCLVVKNVGKKYNM